MKIRKFLDSILTEAAEKILYVEVSGVTEGKFGVSDPELDAIFDQYEAEYYNISHGPAYLCIQCSTNNVEGGYLFVDVHFGKP